MVKFELGAVINTTLKNLIQTKKQYFKELSKANNFDEVIDFNYIAILHTRIYYDKALLIDIQSILNTEHKSISQEDRFRLLLISQLTNTSRHNKNNEVYRNCASELYIKFFEEIIT